MSNPKIYKCLHCGNEKAERLFVLEKYEDIQTIMGRGPISVITRATEEATTSDFRCEKCQDSDDK